MANKISIRHFKIANPIMFDGWQYVEERITYVTCEQDNPCATFIDDGFYCASIAVNPSFQNAQENMCDPLNATPLEGVVYIDSGEYNEYMQRAAEHYETIYRVGDEGEGNEKYG